MAFLLGPNPQDQREEDCWLRLIQCLLNVMSNLVAAWSSRAPQANPRRLHVQYQTLSVPRCISQLSLPANVLPVCYRPIMHPFHRLLRDRPIMHFAQRHQQAPGHRVQLLQLRQNRHHLVLFCQHHDILVPPEAVLP